MGPCPDANVLARAASAGLWQAEGTLLEKHLAECPGCRRVVAELRSVEPPAGSGDRDAARPVDDRLAPGSSLGRYLVLRTLDAGAMGVVYAAYDPQLERQVALKVLRADLAADDDARARLLKEARAMARLAHPNVVAVHEAGEDRGRVYIAMELVEGVTLDRWLRPGRAIPEIVAVFAQAARALGAAHASGIVHRDFKPKNVLVGKDGRVRVTDFGLVRLLDLGADPAHAERGELAGTPAYMSPEQVAGRAADGRADQFAFGVALYEALLGSRPFTIEELARLGERTATAPGWQGRRLPRWLKGLVARALQADPDRRYPSMEALAADLTRDRRRVRTRLALAAAAVVLATGTALATRVPQHLRLARCRARGLGLQAAWSPERQQAIHQAILATHLPYGEDTWRTVESILGRYSSAWATSAVQACEDEARGSSFPPPAERTACLDSRRDQFQALSDLFANADPGVTENAVPAAGALPRLDDCTDPHLLGVSFAQPDEPGARAQLATLRSEMAEVAAMQAVGRSREALVRSRALAARAHDLGAAEIEANALAILGYCEWLTGDPGDATRDMERAWLRADAAKDDVRRFVTAVDLAEFAQDASDPGTAGVWRDRAAATLTRLGQNDPLRADLLKLDGEIAEGAARFADADRSFAEAIALKERAGESRDGVANLLIGRSEALEGMGREDRAVEMAQQALAIDNPILGSGHPIVANESMRLGEVLAGTGHAGEGIAMMQRALGVLIANFGPQGARTAWAEDSLANVLLATGRCAEAGEHAGRAVAIRQGLGPSFDLGVSLLTRAQIEVCTRAFADALADVDRSASLLGDASGQGQLLATLHACRGEALLGLGRRQPARAPLEAAIAEFAANAPALIWWDRPAVVQADLALAEVLWDTESDRPRARALVAEAGKSCATVPAYVCGADSTRIDAWRATHGGP